MTPYEMLKHPTQSTIALDLIRDAKLEREALLYGGSADLCVLDDVDLPPAYKRLLTLVTLEVMEAWVTEHDRIPALVEQVDRLEDQVQAYVIQLRELEDDLNTADEDILF